MPTFGFYRFNRAIFRFPTIGRDWLRLFRKLVDNAGIERNKLVELVAFSATAYVADEFASTGLVRVRPRLLYPAVSALSDNRLDNSVADCNRVQEEPCERTEMDANLEEYPEIVRIYWYSIDWDVQAIWQLELPAVEIPIGDLAWHLDVPIWPDGEKRYCLTPRQVLAEPQRFRTEANRIENASLKYPIDVFFNRDRWMILDGVHRLAKAWRQKAKLIKVRCVPENAVQKIRAIGEPRA